jgi:hypothetical protein
MSWDQILTLVGGMGKGGETPPPAGTNPNPEMNAPKAPQATPGSAPEAPSFAKKASETMLGSTPRTDSVPNFTGDVMQGMTNPHGLVGQAVRFSWRDCFFWPRRWAGDAIFEFAEFCRCG